jgi:hypothetical protein
VQISSKTTGKNLELIESKHSKLESRFIMIFFYYCKITVKEWQNAMAFEPERGGKGPCWILDMPIQAMHV